MALSLMNRDKARSEELVNISAYVFDFSIGCFAAIPPYVHLFLGLRSVETPARTQIAHSFANPIDTDIDALRPSPIIETKLQYLVRNRAIPSFPHPSGTQPNPYQIKLPSIHPSTPILPRRPSTARTPRVHFRRVSTNIQPTGAVLISPVAVHFHHDLALAVRSGDRKAEAIVGKAGVENADGVADGEAEDGAGAGAQGEAAG